MSEKSLMPLPQLPQNQIGVMTWIVDVVKHGRAAEFAGVVDNDITKAEDSLQYRSGNRYVLYFGKRNVSRRARNQTVIDFDFRVGQRVAHHVPFQVVISGNQQQTQRHRQRDVPGYVDEAHHGEKYSYEDGSNDGRGIPNLNEQHRWARGEDHALNIVIGITRGWTRSLARDPRFFGIMRRQSTLIAESAIWV